MRRPTESRGIYPDKAWWTITRRNCNIQQNRWPHEILPPTLSKGTWNSITLDTAKIISNASFVFMAKKKPFSEIPLVSSVSYIAWMACILVASCFHKRNSQIKRKLFTWDWHLMRRASEILYNNGAFVPLFALLYWATRGGSRQSGSTWNDDVRKREWKCFREASLHTHYGW